VPSLGAPQKLFNFNALWGGQGAPKTGAFQRRGGGGESQRAPQVPAFGDGEREGAMENIAGAERIYGVDSKSRCSLPARDAG
jgi:hypothetical protein